MTSKIAKKLADGDYRRAFVESQINVGIPFQIRALMKARGWTQERLAKETGMLQPRISALLRPGRVRPNIETLRRISEAFDCGLAVRFVSISELVNWSENFDPDSFNVPRFEDDTGFVGRRPPCVAALGRQEQRPLEEEQRMRDNVVSILRGGTSDPLEPSQRLVEQTAPILAGCGR